MKTRRRTEITVETHRVLLIGRTAASKIAWCPECAAKVRVIAPEEAAFLIHVNVRSIYRSVEAGLLHFTEPPASPLLICLNSLMRARDQGEIA